MKATLLLLLLPFVSCTNSHETTPASSPESTDATLAGKHWEGAFTNGMKQTYISFDVAADGKKVENVTFKGYWRCDGKLEQTTLGPEKAFPLKGNRADGVIVEPEGGGSTAMRFEFHGVFKGSEAEGTFRINLNALGCDTYKLNWKAKRK